jgi:hypothetical protein
MSTIWVKEFTGGLDSRRLPETATGGTLITAQDGHINRGGELEKRAAFVPTYTLPAGQTKNLAAVPAGLVVFGDTAPPANMPVGVSYQRLQHPDGLTALSRVLSYDRYASKIYAAAEFVDGARHHFYNAVRVLAWYDGRARAAITVSGGASSSSLNSLKVNGVDIISAGVNWSGNDVAFAAAIAAAINSDTTTPDYTATSNGATVNIIAGTAGTGSNDLGVTYTETALTVSPASGTFALTGGVDTTNAAPASGSVEITGGVGTDTMTMLEVNGVDILGATVTWTSSNANTASLIADQVNNFTSTPDYSATVKDAVVTITAVDDGSALNGQTFVPTVTGTFGIGNIQALAGGVDAKAVYVPGTFVKTKGSRMHSVSGPNAHYSGIQQPTQWTSDAIGAGLTDLSTQAENSENLKSIGVYQGNMVYFADLTTQIWSIDSDPTLNKQSQILSNTGTTCPRSVTKYGDNDLMYLDESGVRSIRARDASNAAITTDIGTPIDTLITAKLRALSTDDRLVKVIGLINPIDGRFWLCFPDEIFVFTRYDGSRVSAWSTYKPTYYDQNGTLQSFTIDDAVVNGRRVYLRGGDTIYCYGGVSTGLQTDDTACIGRVPYLDHNTPTVDKQWEGIDVACRGTWKVEAFMDPTEAGFNTSDTVATVTDTTFTGLTIPFQHTSTHISLQFTSQGAGDARLASFAIRLKSDKPDD